MTIKSLFPLCLKLGRYLISGATATGVNIGTTYLLTEIFGLWYLFSATIGFFFGFISSFLLQKFWTFEDKSRDRIKKQLPIYFLITLFNLFCNTFGVYVLVEYMGLWYVVAQVTVGVIVALVNFFLYKRFVFTVSVDEVAL